MSVQFQAECLASIELEEHFLKRGRDVAGWVAASANGPSDVTQVFGNAVLSAHFASQCLETLCL